MAVNEERFVDTQKKKERFTLLIFESSMWIMVRLVKKTVIIFSKVRDNSNKKVKDNEKFLLNLFLFR